MKTIIPCKEFIEEINIRGIQSVESLDFGTLYQMNGRNDIFSVYRCEESETTKIILHSSFTKHKHIIYSWSNADDIAWTLNEMPCEKVYDFEVQTETSTKFLQTLKYIEGSDSFVYNHSITGSSVVLLPFGQEIKIGYDSMYELVFSDFNEYEGSLLKAKCNELKCSTGQGND